MPAPVRTTNAEIVAVARDLLEGGGPDRITMQAVADRVGVKAPSLYKRVRDRDALLALVADAALADLRVRVAAATGERDPRDALVSLAGEIRRFAHERPESFRFVFAPGAGDGRREAALAEAAAPLLEVTTALCGPADALPAARTLTAWSTGFLLMELTGAFRLGGDVDRAWEWGLERLVLAIAGPIARLTGGSIGAVR
ncbi:TetR/AcrR family transcriptional regulator [Agromyces seonyuensis]|uniref:TetR family transcriptional regulator n=1 Tax=Agromyces seonyuensis TaxID=2662446 RepID=A0A6I4P3Z5_9MICO|nr:TetR-like C-terminal domain-containing protein [Agromyces seonyuensis]MWB97994.1 TetR family transcriptional regulator [Agromyces seonyuensis]